MEQKNSMSVASKVLNASFGEAELCRMISRNNRRINRVSKGHFSPVSGESHSWKLAKVSPSADMTDLESSLAYSDQMCRMSLNEHLASRTVRVDRKRGKVRATASRAEKARMRRPDCFSGRIRKKIYCAEYSRPKVLFETREAAERYIEYENALKRPVSKSLYAYYCGSCRGWHISSWEKYRHLAS